MLPIIISIILVLILIILKKVNKIPKFYFGILSILIIFLCFEFTLFNINSYRLKFSNYEEKIFNIKDCELQNIEYDQNADKYKITEDEAYIILDNINCNVGTIYMNCEILDNIINTEKQDNKRIKTIPEKLEYQILYTDETSSNFRELDSKILLNSIEKSKYTTCYLSGKSDKIAIKILNSSEVEFRITNIKINKEIPFELNLSRYIFLVSIAILIYCLKNLNFWNITFENNADKVKNMILTTISLFIILNLFIAGNTIVNNPDIYCKELAESIVKGQFYLEEEPSDKLLRLENPYDATIRSRSYSKWDTVLFDGKYYVYFGILPELILFVPYMLVKHTFLPSGKGVIIFSIFTLFSLGIFLFEILKKWFKDIPIKLWFMAEVILLSGCIIFNLIGRPYFYEVAVSSALCFASLGLLFSFYSFFDEKRKYLKLFLASLCLALSVACRPTMLFISFIILIPLIKLFIENIKQRKNIIKTIVSVRDSIFNNWSFINDI